MALYLVLLALVILALTIRIYEKSTNAICKSRKNLNGRTALVTGGTAGMGLEIAIEFAKRGARVIIACPFQEEGTTALKTIKEKTGSDKVIFKLLDLGCLKSVRKFAADILKTEDRLDILINNAGVGIPARSATADGLDYIMQVNYFGHFLLTLLLLPLLTKTGTPAEPVRIVNTSSLTHFLGIFGINDLKKCSRWPIQSYSKSKLCLALFSIELSKRLQRSNVVINSVDPGIVGTGIYHSAGVITGHVLTFICNNFYKTPWEGAQTALHVALDTEAGKVSGKFFRNCRQSWAAWINNAERSKNVWEESVTLIQITEEEIGKLF